MVGQTAEAISEGRRFESVRGVPHSPLSIVSALGEVEEVADRLVLAITAGPDWASVDAEH
jgi:hypothetical protein